MEPVRIKYWGLVWLTRRMYLIITGIAALAIIILLIVFIRLDRLPQFRWPWEPLPRHSIRGLQALIADHFWTFILLCVLAELVDIVATMRAFTRKEAEMRNEIRPPNVPCS